jgi:TPR repeat protein
VHIDPMKPKLKVPETQRLKLNRDILLSTYAFKLKLCRYNEEEANSWYAKAAVQGHAAGAYTRPLLSSTKAVLVSETFCVPSVTSYHPTIH